MKKIFPYCVFIVLMVLVCFSGFVAGSNTKIMELNRKMDEITILRAEIDSKIDQAEIMGSKLKVQIEEFQSEIIEEKDQHKLVGFDDAVKNLRIGYNLQLIQQLMAYNDKINQRINYFLDANETMDFYFRQVSDDVMIIQTLDDMEVDALIDRINLVLDEFIPQSRKSLFNLEDVQYRDIKEVWNLIVQAK